MIFTNANEQTISINGVVFDRLNVTVKEAKIEELYRMPQTITVNGTSYVGYSRLKSFNYDVDNKAYEVILERPTDIESRLNKIADLVLIDVDKMTLEEYKAYAIATSKDRIEEILAAGVEFQGKMYNGTKEKQDLLSNQLGLFIMNVQAEIPDTLEWNTKDGVCEEYTYEYLLGLANTLKASARPLVKRQQIFEVQVNGATEHGQVEKLLSDFR